MVGQEPGRLLLPLALLAAAASALAGAGAALAALTALAVLAAGRAGGASRGRASRCASRRTGLGLAAALLAARALALLACAGGTLLATLAAAALAGALLAVAVAALLAAVPALVRVAAAPAGRRRGLVAARAPLRLRSRRARHRRTVAAFVALLLGTAARQEEGTRHEQHRAGENPCERLHESLPIGRVRNQAPHHRGG